MYAGMFYYMVVLVLVFVRYTMLIIIYITPEDAVVPLMYAGGMMTLYIHMFGACMKTVIYIFDIVCKTYIGRLIWCTYA